MPGQEKPFLLRRPSSLWFLQHAEQLDQLIQPPKTPEELVAFSRAVLDLLDLVIVKPKVRASPGADELSPDDLDFKDVLFLRQWVIEGMTEENRETEKFFRGRRDATAAGASGSDVLVPPEPASV